MVSHEMKNREPLISLSQSQIHDRLRTSGWIDTAFW
jgi:hypothetical protein